MKANIEYVKKKFDEYNHLMFNGELQPLPFALSKAKTYNGALFYKREKNADGTWHYSNFVFRISTVYDLSEDKIEDTIIHEMIHYYIFSKQLHDTKPHGKLFVAIMNEINNKFNRHVTVSNHITRDESDTDKRVKPHLICISRLRTGKRCFTVVAKSRLFVLWDAMPKLPQTVECKWYLSIDPYFNRFRKALRPVLYWVPDEELDAHLVSAKELVRQDNVIRVKR